MACRHAVLFDVCGRAKRQQKRKTMFYILKCLFLRWFYDRLPWSISIPLLTAVQTFKYRFTVS